MLALTSAHPPQRCALKILQCRVGMASQAVSLRNKPARPAANNIDAMIAAKTPTAGT